MKIRVLLAVQTEGCADLMRTLLDAALQLVPLEIRVDQARTRVRLMERVRSSRDDVVFLDWDLAGASTPDLVRQITGSNPRIRVVALLPGHLRQYHQRLWAAGACSSMPKEYMDQEWLSGLLCFINRAMTRERSIKAGPGASLALPAPTEAPALQVTAHATRPG